jgi:hypothetical protein
MQAALASTTGDYIDDQYTDVTVVDVAHIHLHLPLTCITGRHYKISATLTDAHGRQILITEVPLLLGYYQLICDYSRICELTLHLTNNTCAPHLHRQMVVLSMFQYKINLAGCW